MIDSEKVKESICNIESEICFLHGLISAHEDSCTQPTVAQQAIPTEALREIAAIADEVERGYIGPVPDISLIRNGINRLRQL